MKNLILKFKLIKKINFDIFFIFKYFIFNIKNFFLLKTLALNKNESILNWYQCKHWQYMHLTSHRLVLSQEDDKRPGSSLWPDAWVPL